MNSKWVTRPLANLFEIGSGKTMSSSARSGKDKAPFLRTSNVYWDEIRLDSVDEMAISPAELESKSLAPGDLLVCEGGEVGRAAVWQGQRPLMSFQNHLHRLRARGSDVNPRFYVYFLQAAFTQFDLYNGAANRTTIPNLSRSRLAELDVPHPPAHEQAAIAGALAMIRGAVQLSERLAVATVELKAAAMEQLFTRGLHGEAQKETEIGPIPESWSLVQVREVRRSLQYGTSDRSTDLGRYPVLRIPNITTSGIDQSNLKFANISEYAASTYLLERGDLLFIRTNGVIDRLGTCAVFDGAPECSIFASYLIRARLDTERATPKFVAYFLGSEVGVREIAVRAIPASDGKFNLNMPAIDSLLLPLPPTLEEQDAVAAIIDSIGEAIALHKRKTLILEQLFESLLNGLMSGEIDVNDVDYSLLESTA